MSENKVTVGAVAKIKNRVKKLGSDEGGFTLVEMVVALTVVLLMAGAALLAAPGIVKDSKIASCSAKADAIANAITASYAHYGNYSKTGASDLVTDGYLVSAPATADYTIGTADADGVLVTFGASCSDDFAPSTWGAQAQTDGHYQYGTA